MNSRIAMPALLMLAVYCAACAPLTTSGHPTPAPAQSPRPDSATPTISVPIGTPSSTALPTLSPAPREFTESFDAKPPYWVFVQTPGPQAFAGPTIRDGFLVFDFTVPNQWGYALYDARSYGDVLVETQVQSRTGGDGASGLVCNYDNRKGWYEFNVFADQTYQVLFGQWLSKEVVRYTPLYQGSSQAIRNDVNRIGLQCQGNMLTPSVNGIPLRKWLDQNFGLQGGKVGLSASAFADAPFTIAFDWVMVSEP